MTGNIGSLFPLCSIARQIFLCNSLVRLKTCITTLTQLEIIMRITELPLFPFIKFSNENIS